MSVQLEKAATPVIASIAKCHLLLILIKLLALWYNMTHYYSQHSQFLQEHQELAHFSFCP